MSASDPPEWYDPPGWEDVAPGWISQNAEFLERLVKYPGATVVGLVGAWIVRNLIINPVGWGIAYYDWAVSQAATTIDTTVRSSYGTAGRAVYNALIGTEYEPGAFYLLVNTLEQVIPLGGLAAPIATGIVISVIALVGFSLVYLLVRILLDAVPGGGAFT